MFRKAKSVMTACVVVVLTCLTQPAAAQERHAPWGTVSNVTAVAALASSLLMPRIYNSSPEATVGWRSRWHLSVLAPTMTQVSLGLLNEVVLKDAFKEPRPGCEESGPGLTNCESYALFSTPSYLSASSLGQGVAVFMVDSLKHSNGRFNFASLAGNVLLPLSLTGVSVAGRVIGHYENFGQSLASAGVGLGTGLLFGLLYSTFQDPRCGYSGNLICW